MSSKLSKAYLKGSCHQFWLEPWNASVVLVVGLFEAVTHYCQKKHIYTPEYKINGVGFSMRMVQEKDDRRIGYLIWIPAMTGTAESCVTLAHECLHIACNVLDDCGVVYNDDAKEVLTYTFDSIYRKCLLRSAGSKKKEKQK